MDNVVIKIDKNYLILDKSEKFSRCFIKNVLSNDYLDLATEIFKDLGDGKYLVNLKIDIEVLEEER